MKRRISHILIVLTTIFSFLLQPLAAAAQTEDPPSYAKPSELILMQGDPLIKSDGEPNLGIWDNMPASAVETGFVAYQYAPDELPWWYYNPPQFPVGTATSDPSCALEAIVAPNPIRVIICVILSYGPAVLRGGAVVGTVFYLQGSQSPQIWEVYIPKEVIAAYDLQSGNEAYQLLYAFNPPQDSELWKLLGDFNLMRHDRWRPGGDPAQRWYDEHTRKHGEIARGVYTFFWAAVTTLGWNNWPKNGRNQKCYFSELWRGPKLPNYPTADNLVLSTRYVATFVLDGPGGRAIEYLVTMGVPGWWVSTGGITEWHAYPRDTYLITSYEFKSDIPADSFMDRQRMLYGYKPLVNCNNFPGPPPPDRMSFASASFPSMQNRNWAAATHAQQ